MISKAILKQTKQLHQKKFRKEQQCFIVEGEKLVSELLNSDFTIRNLFATAEWKSTLGQKVDIVTDNELKEISALETPNKVLAIVAMKPESDFTVKPDGNYLVLDGIRDPGNMGTLLRIADWFGIDGIICSPDSVEIYNSKVVQSSMGSVFRIPVMEAELNNLLNKVEEIAIYGAVLNGTSVYDLKPEKGWMLIIGNESTGISHELLKKCTDKISIPSYSKFQVGAESLNAAVAAAVLCGELKRSE